MRMRSLVAACLSAAAWTRAAQALPPVEIGLDFTGPTRSESGFIPPDSMGAVGDEHVVVLVNGRYEVYRKSDGAELASTSLDAFWQAAGVEPIDNSFDPRVLYDPAADRWYAVSADGAPEPNNFLFAVSRTSDPTDGWAGFALDSDSTDEVWADFPMLGYDADAVYLVAPMFPVVGPDRPTGSTFVVLPKDDLLAPAPSVAGATLFERTSLAQSGFQPQAVVNQDGTDVAAKFYAGTLTFLGQIQMASIDGPPDAPSFDGANFVAIEGASEPPDAVQPGGVRPLDAGDSRFGANLVLQNGVSWAVQSIGFEGRSAVRWMQIDPVADIVLDAGVIFDPALDLTYPSIAVNELDQIVIGMSGSGESVFASAYAVVGEKDDLGVTSFGELLLLAAGQASYSVGATRNRWGDYSATVVDPSDPSSFWTFQEFALAENQWALRVTQIRVIPEPATLALCGLGLLALSRRRLR
jgi:hypothetical protein